MFEANKNLPNHIRKALPELAQTVFREKYNSEIKDSPESQIAAMNAAWWALKDDWETDEDGAWRLKAGEGIETLYVYRELLDHTNLIAWMATQGFTNALDGPDMHVTIAFSRTAVDHSLITPDSDNLLIPDDENRQVRELGEDGAVVLLLDSSELTARWEEIIDLGASWDFPRYRPHVTLTYNGAPPLEGVDPYSGSLMFGPEIVTEINEDFMAARLKRNTKSAAHVCKVDQTLGLVFGWAIISKIDGEDYYDIQEDHIPEDVMLRAAADFMASKRVAGDMHQRDQYGQPVKAGEILFAFPLTTDIAKAMEISTPQTGLMIAMRPADPEILAKFTDGTYTGFSIGGYATSEDI